MSDVLTIMQQLKKSGWLVTPVEGGSHLIRPQTGQSLFMSTTQHWLCLEQPAELQPGLPIASEQFERWHSLLQRNERMFMVKYSLDRQDIPLLNVEIPLKNATVPLLNKAFGSLARYATSKEPVPIIVEPDESATIVSIRSYLREQQPTMLHSTHLEPGISKDIFRRYMSALQGSGWGIVKALRDFPWTLGYKNRLRLFYVYFSITRNWVTFQVPLIDDQVETVLQTNEEARTLFVQYLLRLNALWFMAKLGITDRKQVLLQLEIPSEAFDFSLLRFMTRTISAYIDRYAQEIQIMGALQGDPRLSKLLSQLA